MGNPFEAPGAFFDGHSADVLLALLTASAPLGFPALLTSVASFRRARMKTIADGPGGPGGLSGLDYFVERELDRLLVRGIVRRQSSAAGPTYALVMRNETLAWLRQHHAARLPENLRE